MEAEIMQALNAVELKVIYGIVKVSVAIGIAMFLKTRIENLVAYYQFMSNKRLGIGVKVKVRGEKGKIKDYDKKWIFVYNEDGDEIIVPIKNWLSEKWTLLGNGEDK